MAGHRLRVELVKVGALPPGLARDLAARLGESGPWRAAVAERIVEPRPAFDALRQQYSADAILRALLDPPPPPGTCRLGLTHVDLFVPVFTHLFGYALLGGRAAVVSSYRLRPEFEGDAPEPARLLDRIVKEALHELGHVAGLVHCPTPWCVMKSSRLAEEVDLRDAAYCPACLGSLQEGGARGSEKATTQLPRSAGGSGDVR